MSTTDDTREHELPYPVAPSRAWRPQWWLVVTTVTTYFLGVGVVVYEVGHDGRIQVLLFAGFLQGLIPLGALLAHLLSRR